MSIELFYFYHIVKTISTRNRQINGQICTQFDIIHVLQSRNFYVQRMTPKYLVGLKAVRTPAEFIVDILPYNSWSWGVVQNIAQNPRIRLNQGSGTEHCSKP